MLCALDLFKVKSGRLLCVSLTPAKCEVWDECSELAALLNEGLSTWLHALHH